MLNPIAELARHYVKAWRLRSPVVIHREPSTVTIGLRSPKEPTNHDAVRTVTAFASSAELAIAHRAPNACFSDEIRVRKNRALAEHERLKIYRWPDAPIVRATVGPLAVMLDTAERQAESYAAFCDESAEHCAQHETEHTCYTLASRHLPHGTAQQIAFDPHAKYPPVYEIRQAILRTIQGGKAA